MKEPCEVALELGIGGFLYNHHASSEATSLALSRDCVGLACLRWDTVAANAHDRVRKGALRRARQGRAAPGVARERAREVIPKRRAHKESESSVEHQEESVAHSRGSRRSARIHASRELLRHA
ncbi:g6637 [Coccomyxa viridis]|uniref:G6637 protein n=1 Tax=Coccomyxa viridis TaxID=1274662 RepID=A0ABP1G0S8_9CHLO